MRRIRLIHWKEAEAAERATELRALGYDVEHKAFDGPEALRRMRDNPPAAVVIDLTRVPSHGRDLGVALRSFKPTRSVPLVFVGGEEEKVKRIKGLLPDAVYATWDDVACALQLALAHPPENPVVPRSRFEAYSETPLPKKLGIRPDSLVAFVDAPDRFERSIGKLPKGTSIIRTMTGRQHLGLWFVRSRNRLEARVGRLAVRVGDGGLWIIWPKKSSGIRSDLNQNIVRRAGLAAGLVDYKICAVDETWSGLLFTRRKLKS
jgi:CheY-like chemotaxis protein